MNLSSNVGAGRTNSVAAAGVSTMDAAGKGAVAALEAGVVVTARTSAAAIMPNVNVGAETPPPPVFVDARHPVRESDRDLLPADFFGEGFNPLHFVDMAYTRDGRIRRDEIVGHQPHSVDMNTASHALEVIRGVDVMFQQEAEFRRHVGAELRDSVKKVKEEETLQKAAERNVALLGSQVTRMTEVEEKLQSELDQARERKRLWSEPPRSC